MTRYAISSSQRISSAYTSARSPRKHHSDRREILPLLLLRFVQRTDRAVRRPQTAEFFPPLLPPPPVPSFYHCCTESCDYMREPHRQPSLPDDSSTLESISFAIRRLLSLQQFQAHFLKLFTDRNMLRTDRLTASALHTVISVFHAVIADEPLLLSLRRFFISYKVREFIAAKDPEIPMPRGQTFAQ